MLKMLLIVPALAASAVAATAMTSSGEMSREAQAQVMRLAVAAQCPNRPEAMQIATGKAYAYSLRHPLDLPPWQVFVTARNLQADATGLDDNMFADGFCDQIIAGEM